MIPLLEKGMKNAKLLRWLVKDGDHVSVGQPIFDIELDEYITQVENIDPGIISISAAEGEIYDVGFQLGSVVTSDEERVDFEVVGLKLTFEQRNYIESVRGDLSRKAWIGKKVSELFDDAIPESTLNKKP